MKTKESNYLFTSESVSPGHPDKICDQISDRVVDAYLAQDPNSRVAVETLVTSGKVVMAGEVRSKAALDNSALAQLARDTIRKIGYEQEKFHWNKVSVDVYVHDQSSDIAQGVDSGSNLQQHEEARTAASPASDAGEGAGDQGIMFGYAVNETEALMPAPIYYSHLILQSLYEAWRCGDEPLLGPDAKSQVTLRYVDGIPVRADTVLVSTQHVEHATQAEVAKRVTAHIHSVLPKGWIDDQTRVLVNPTGKFVIGGPDGDAGLTGRKIVVDTYGGAAPHGGGAFSGKDASKVDRSAAYAARYLAKNVVASGIAHSCLVQLSYAIGICDPVSLYVDLDENAQCSPDAVAELLSSLVDLRPSSIRKRFGLDKPVFEQTATFGHFGRQVDQDAGLFLWESTDIADEIQKALAT